MFERRAKVGPKGQVVIPKHLRDEFHLAPGEEVVVGTDGTKVTISAVSEDPVAFFEGLARSAKGRRARFDPHEAEGEFLERDRRRRR